jgi:nucleotide-binding universal stress UspA family protein
MVMEFIAKNKRHSFKSLHGENVKESINQYVEDCNAELVVVVKQQHHFLESILHESLSKEISMNSKVPVLIMREKRS